jgi:hypothetical protein
MLTYALVLAQRLVQAHASLAQQVPSLLALLVLRCSVLLDLLVLMPPSLSRYSVYLLSSTKVPILTHLCRDDDVGGPSSVLLRVGASPGELDVC